MIHTRIYIKILLVVLSIMFVVVPYFSVPFSPSIHNLIINPAMWISFGLITYLFLPKEYRKFNFEKTQIREYAFMGSLIFILIYFSSGVVLGFSNSPYNRDLMGILTNFWMIVVVVFFKEVFRDGFIKTTNKYNKVFILVFITLFFTMIEVNLSNFLGSFASFHTFMRFFSRSFASVLIGNTFLTYLSYKEGFISSILYKVPISLVMILTPVFPENNVAVLSAIEMLVPLFIYLSIENLHNYKSVFERPENISLSQKLGNFSYFIMLIVLFSFTLGVLPYSPTVIASNSMYPEIHRGDVIIMKEIDFEDVKINDIIVYNLEGTKIIHRVLEIKNFPEQKFFVTKGDNNAGVDKKYVNKNQVEGIVVATIPKAGYPTLLIREILFGTGDLPDIERGGE